jgi:integrase/recombinase XerD
MLLARLGLRSSEVAFLELDAIDWNTGTFSVHTKSGLRNEFSLPFAGR